MKIKASCALLVWVLVGIGAFTAARAEDGFEPETASGNPLATLTNIGLGDEYTHDSSSKEKFIPSANWAIGEKTGRFNARTAVGAGLRQKPRLQPVVGQ
ncbi:MAG: hypothetical protein WCP45_08840 [Verrucomicrobiota bacterium]